MMIPWMDKAMEITPYCFNWCREQHFTNDMQGLWLIGIALALNIVFYFMVHYGDKLNIDENRAVSVRSALLMTSNWLKIAFLAYNLWMR